MCFGKEYFFGWIQAGGVEVHRKPQIAEDRAVCRSNKTNVALGCNGPDEMIFQHLLQKRQENDSECVYGGLQSTNPGSSFFSH